jgi:hypothetical protein
MERQLVDDGAWGGQADRPHPGGGRDLVDGPDHRQDRGLDVGQREQAVVDGEPTLEQPVVVDELAEELSQCGARPGHPAVGLQEASLPLARQQRLPIVKLEDEVDAVAHRLHGIEQRKAVAARPRGESAAAEDPVGDQVRQARGQVLGEPEGHTVAGVDGAAEGHQRGQAVVAAVGGHLVAEHPALGVATKVDVAAGQLTHIVDGVRDGEHVVGQCALEATLDAFRGAEVDHPRIGAVVVEGGDRAGGRRDVVDLGGQHHRRHEQDGRSDAARAVAVVIGRRVVVAQAVDAVLGRHLVGRWLLLGIEPAEASHLERVLGSRAHPADGSGDPLGQQWHAAYLRSNDLVSAPQSRYCRGE